LSLHLLLLDLNIVRFQYQTHNRLKSLPPPSCKGMLVAKAAKYEETELADISGV
jgi:hypothetical protein